VKLRKIAILAVVLLAAFSVASAFAAGEMKTVKAGFIYVGPVGDLGFTNAHDVGRRYAESKLPWLKTIYVESVPEGDAARFIDRLIQEEKCDVVFTCSYGFMDDTVKAGAKYPNKVFMHCSGYKQSANVGTYFADLYQMYYLNGLMAGALTKSGKIGYVGAFPTPEVVRHINAYALGAKVTNPKAKVEVRWIFSWFDPQKAKEASEALVAAGVDCLAFTEDTQSVVQVGEEHTKAGKQIYTFSHYSPMQKFGPNSCVSGQLVDWGVMYVKILQDLKDGKWSNADMWWLTADKAALLGGDFSMPINPKFVDALKAKSVATKDLGKLSVYDLVMKRYQQMQTGGRDAFDPFTGPVKDNKGVERIKAGGYASKDFVLGPDILWYPDNVIGDVPKS
jgi:basic membrane protein A and related proteins